MTAHCIAWQVIVSDSCHFIAVVKCYKVRHGTSLLLLLWKARRFS